MTSIDGVAGLLEQVLASHGRHCLGWSRYTLKESSACEYAKNLWQRPKNDGKTGSKEGCEVTDKGKTGDVGQVRMVSVGVFLFRIIRPELSPSRVIGFVRSQI